MPRRPPAPLEIVILVVGLIAAAVSGLAAYRVVGLYGDGAFGGGYHRERDPEAGKWLLVHNAVTSSGRVRRVIDENKQLKEVRLDADDDGVDEARAKVDGTAIAGVGFSLAGDGVIDAWAFRDAANQLIRIEVSTRRDGRIDRWEHYAKGKMVRVDEDSNRNGKVDRWSTYDDGILMDTFVDTNEDGQPDDPVGR